MALIMHRCGKCGHPDYWRRCDATVPGGLGPCDPCGCTCTPGKPETAPTWDEAGQPIERIAKPGTKLSGNPGSRGGYAIVTCGCAACKALHKKFTTI